MSVASISKHLIVGVALAGMGMVWLCGSAQSESKKLPDRERRILKLIAEEMKLTEDETYLLYAIRLHEDGRAGKECGVLYTEDGKRLKPYTSWPLSMMENGCLCADKIRTRYRGTYRKNLKKFAAWYTGYKVPTKEDPNPNSPGIDNDYHEWIRCVPRYIRQFKREKRE